MLLFDASIIGGGIGVFIGVAFFLVFAAVAFISYKMLRKSLRWAFRIAIVVIILAVAIGGSAFFFLNSSSKTSRPAPRSANVK